MTFSTTITTTTTTTTIITTTTTAADYPWLPAEMISKILEQLWGSALSNDDRIIFMTSSLLVNKTWSDIYTRISSEAVHIPCDSYHRHYTRILSSGSSASAYASSRCRTLSFRLETQERIPTNCDAIVKQPSFPDMMSNLLYSDHFTLPNLCRINMEYVHSSFEDLLAKWRVFAFPNRVHLNVRYISPVMPHSSNKVFWVPMDNGTDKTVIYPTRQIYFPPLMNVTICTVHN